MAGWDLSNKEDRAIIREAKQRFNCLRVLAHYNLPHCVWGNDAVILHKTDAIIMKYLQVLVPDFDLESTAEHLMRHLKSYKIYNHVNDKIIPSTEEYGENCLVLVSEKERKHSPNYIVLVCQSFYNFDTRDSGNLLEISEFYDLGCKHNGIKYPKFGPLLNSLLFVYQEARINRRPTTLYLCGIRRDLWSLVQGQAGKFHNEMFMKFDRPTPALRKVTEMVNEYNIDFFKDLYFHKAPYKIGYGPGWELFKHCED